MQKLECIKCRGPIHYKPTDLRVVCTCGATYDRERDNPLWFYNGMAQESRDPIDEFLHKAAQHQAETPAQDWPEQRVDIIGQNGNTGEHYAEQPLPAAPSGGGKLAGDHYYRVRVTDPISPELQPYTAECADIIEALGMTFNEGEAFKALWRLAAARQGRGKKGSTPVYDADKVAHYGGRVAVQTRKENGHV